MEGLFILALLLALYFLPSAVDWNKKHCAGIAVLNQLLGWTLLGWVEALVWAVSSPSEGARRGRLDG